MTLVPLHGLRGLIRLSGDSLGRREPAGSCKWSNPTGHQPCVQRLAFPWPTGYFNNEPATLPATPVATFLNWQSGKLTQEPFHSKAGPGIGSHGSGNRTDEAPNYNFAIFFGYFGLGPEPPKKLQGGLDPFLRAPRGAGGLSCKAPTKFLHDRLEFIRRQFVGKNPDEMGEDGTNQASMPSEISTKCGDWHPILTFRKKVKKRPCIIFPHYLR